MIYCIILFILIYYYFLKNKIEKFNPNLDFKDIKLEKNKIINNILNNLYVRSGGINENYSNSCFIKFNNKIVVKKGSNGMNIVIIERSNKMKIKNIVNIDTGINYLQNDVMIDLIQNHINKTDIVVISVKRDAFRLMNTECRFHLKLLGSKLNITKGNASYILIGSKDKKVYYEKISWHDDVFFPHIVYNNLGCWKIEPSIITKKIKLFSNYKNDNLIKTCAIIASSNNVNRYAIGNNYCYLLDENSDYRVRGSGYNCISSNEYKIYQIQDKYTQDFEIKKNTQSYVRIYNDENFRLNKIILEPGIYNNYYFNGIENYGGLLQDEIKSIKIPENMMVIIYDDQNYRRSIRYTIIGPTEISNFREYRMNGPIKKIIVINTINKIIFWALDNFKGHAYCLSYGRHIIPDEYQIKINSINIQLPKCKISMFYDDNFNDFYGMIGNNSVDVKNIFDLDNDRIIKSIIIEYIN